MQKPNVFFLSTSLNTGGTEKFILTLVRNLKTKYEFKIGYLKEKGAVGGLLETEHGLTVQKFGSPWAVKKYLIANKISLIHTFLYRANILGRFAGKMAGTPVVISTQQAIDAWKKPYHAWLDGYTSGWCDSIIANSQAAKDILITRDGVKDSKITIVYNGLNVNNFVTERSRDSILKDLGIEGNKPIILSTIRLHKEKGADLLPEIIARTKKGILLIAGDGPERKSMELRTQQLNLQKRIIFLGWRSNISELLSVAAVLLMPSREESFPQSILEAMALKVPVIASDVGGVKELVINGKTGILVQPEDIHAFADAVSDLTDNQDKAMQMGEESFNRSLLFTEEIMINKIDSIYTELLGRKHAL